MSQGVLHYRAWTGRLHRPIATVWPIARIALAMILRRKLFWGMYALGLTIFLMFFFGQYLLAWAETQTVERTIPVGPIRAEPDKLIRLLRDALKLNGTAETYRNFFWWQGYMVMVILALTGSILVGNDFQFGSLPFYLAKPLGRWHYLGGKCLAVAVFVNLMTTLPALALFFQYGMLDDWSYFTRGGWQIALGDSVLVVPVNPLLPGILGYGVVLTVCLSLFLVATATWLRRTVPMIMAWTTMFLFLRLIAASLVDGLHYDARWRLIDLWNNTFLLGNACLGLSTESIRPTPQPAAFEAALVLGAGCVLSLVYLNRRLHAVEVVTG